MTPDLFRTWLAGHDDASLADLLRSRPDTVLPLPPGIAPLAGRLQLRASVARALRRFSALELATLEAAAELGAELSPVQREDVIAHLLSRAPEAAEAANAAELAEKAIDSLLLHAVFYDADGLRLVKEAMAALPPGWHLLGVSPTGDVSAQVAALEDSQRRILTTLAQAGGLGHSKDAAVDADPSRPIPQLLAAGLLERVDATHVRLPRAVLHTVRGERPVPIPLQPAQRADAGDVHKDAERIDLSGAAQGLELTRRLARLLTHLGEQPAALNKDGRTGARLGQTLAKQLGTDVDDIALLVSLGDAAGLLGTGLTAHVPEPLDKDANYLAPTKQADEWLAAPLATRWTQLITGWLGSSWPHWRGGRLLDSDAKDDRLSTWRSLILEQFTHLAPGASLTDQEAVHDLRFTAPLSAFLLSDDDLSALIAEARAVGVLVGGTATIILREALAGRDLTESAQDFVPAEVTQVIVQADMTIMAPGPLPGDLHGELELIADLEAPGLASMYRITDSSVRRALDAGRTEEQIAGWLTEHALGEVPQGVSYLVSDVARRHGALRGGAALSYLRCTDETVLAQVMGSQAAGEAELTLLAPTVAISPRSLAAVLEVLRRFGFQPVAEDASGATVDVRPEPARVFARPTPSAGPSRTLDESRITAAVAAIRRSEGSGEAGGAGGAGEPAGTDGASHVATLQAAARGGRTVTIRAVDKSGRAVAATVKPLTVAGGQVDALEESTGRVQRFLIHRITNVSMN